MTRSSLLAALAATLLAGGCAEKEIWTAAELYVTSLPEGAAVERDGKPVGRTPVAVSLVTYNEDDEAVALTNVNISVRKDGWSTVTKAIDARAAPEKLDVVLAPVFAAGEEPGAGPSREDAEALYLMGAALQRNGRCEEAMEILLYVRTIAPKAAKPWRESGRCLAKLGDADAAAAAWERYLILDPLAADAEEFRRKVEKLRGARTIDMGDVGPAVRE